MFKSTLSLILCGTTLLARVPECSTHNPVVSNSISKNVRSDSGKTIIATFAFTDVNGNIVKSVDPNIINAWNQASAQWSKGPASLTSFPNTYTFTGLKPDLTIQYSADDSHTGPTAGCAAYHYATGVINYGNNFLAAAQLNPAAAVFVFAHELGHAFGLADAPSYPTTGATVMNQIDVPPDTADSVACIYANIWVPTSKVYPLDLHASNSCVTGQDAGAGRYLATKQNSSPGVNGPQSDQFPTCIYTSTTYNFYVDGKYDSSQTFVTNVVCR